MASSNEEIAQNMRACADAYSAIIRERNHSIFIPERNYALDDALQAVVETLHANARVFERGGRS